MQTNSEFLDIIKCCLTKKIFIIPIVVSFAIWWNPGATCLYLWPNGITLYLYNMSQHFVARDISSDGLYEWTLYRGNIYFKLYSLFFDYKFIFNSNTNEVFNSVNISCLRLQNATECFEIVQNFKSSFLLTEWLGKALILCNDQVLLNGVGALNGLAHMLHHLWGYIINSFNIDQL